VNIQGEKIDSGRNKFGLFTGDHVRCGINTSFMPGIKLGNNAFIGAGITVAQDVPDNMFVYAKTELIMKENKATTDLKRREAMKKKLK
jgi:bifunctional UDP-N-acetylglucosamine pyrophosphorylase/glucosamine-1-phosphate N-acetyltransferase